MAKGQKKATIYRVVKFEIFPSQEQQTILKSIATVLLGIFNGALKERRALFECFVAPVYRLMHEAKKEGNKELHAELKKKATQVAKENQVTLFDQINALTAKRGADASFAAVPRNWQEETLDTLDGAYKSFMMLRKQGDMDARTPKDRHQDACYEIPGRYGFAVKEGKFILSCPKVAQGTLMEFPIPAYQQGKLAEAVKMKKFTLYRDERELAKKGRWWVSIAYEIPLPETKPVIHDEIVYVAVGASSIGVVSSKEEVIKLWRPDKFWKPKIDEIIRRMIGKVKGSRAWLRMNNAKRIMQQKMARQQKQNHREVVLRKLLAHGIHFVVNEVVIRSKQDKLADAKKKDRGGTLGLNWAAQNTGSIAHLIQHLEEKVKEYGGTVTKVRTTPPSIKEKGHENKILMARHLRSVHTHVA